VFRLNKLSQAGIFPQRGGMSQSLNLFHGTSWDRAMEIGKSGFIPSASGRLGQGIYVAREDKARRFAEDSSRHGGAGGNALVEVIITFRNAKYVSGDDLQAGSSRAMMPVAPITRAYRPTWSGV
jgi:hypothetical protein